MGLTFYWYPTCGSCKKAKKWLDTQKISYTPVHIVKHPPNKDILRGLIEKSGLPAKKFFNTSGKKYRELNMKDKIKDMTLDDMLDWLVSDGMLIKRPIITDGNKVTLGFKEEVLEETWL